MLKDLERICEELKAQGLRMTDVRRNLIKYILARKGHWTIQQLSRDVAKSIRGVGVATVYRTVALLQKQGVLTETHIGPQSTRYEIQPENHHDHLNCLQCGKIFEFENEEIEALQEIVAKRLGFKLKDHRMELFGDCQRSECKKRKS
jgi:Fur family ferric uptake transcriptional regulator